MLGGQPAAVARYFGTAVFSVVNLIFLVSSCSVLDSTFASTSKLFGPELMGAILKGRPMPPAKATHRWDWVIEICMNAATEALTLLLLRDAAMYVHIWYKIYILGNMYSGLQSSVTLVEASEIKTRLTDTFRSWSQAESILVFVQKSTRCTSACICVLQTCLHPISLCQRAHFFVWLLAGRPGLVVLPLSWWPSSAHCHSWQDLQHLMQPQYLELWWSAWYVTKNYILNSLTEYKSIVCLATSAIFVYTTCTLVSDSANKMR